MEDFKREVLEGLSGKQKSLPSKYFYDKKGDSLFQQIMAMPEYYLTRAEMEIFSTRAEEIVASFQMDRTQRFDLIELGAGDGSKTILLLQALQGKGYTFDYLPIDISSNALNGLAAMLAEKMPDIIVKPEQDTYFQALGRLNNHHPKVILFLGSSLGNLSDEEAARFIYELGSSLHSGDKLLLGLDTIKPEAIVLPAYNDAQGITREFNLNLLDRINRELEADFIRAQFEHCPEYDEQEGWAKSYLVSKREQEVTVKTLGRKFHFGKGERIYTEISRKYSLEILERILGHTDFEITAVHTDSKRYFMDVILNKR